MKRKLAEMEAEAARLKGGAQVWPLHQQRHALRAPRRRPLGLAHACWGHLYRSICSAMPRHLRLPCPATPLAPHTPDTPRCTRQQPRARRPRRRQRRPRARPQSRWLKRRPTRAACTWATSTTR